MAKGNQKFGLWSHRKLTIEGKVLVLRNDILPVLQYTAQAWPPHNTVRQAITRAIFSFIWGSKMDSETDCHLQGASQGGEEAS